jgi:exopolyphosphatase/guanosine-5'-triphosphate,3'-diphosphate pyrophosphatase
MIRASKVLHKIQDASYELAYTDFITLKQILVTRSQVALLAIPGMDPMRVDMIGIAAIFVDFLMRKLALKRIIQSQYSLKEGVIYSLSNET